MRRKVRISFSHVGGGKDYLGSEGMEFYWLGC